MLYNFDGKEQNYLMEFPDGRKSPRSLEDLRAFYDFGDHGMDFTFEEMIRKLDKGILVVADDYSFDFNVMDSVFNGKILISKIDCIPQKEETAVSECKHINKYINTAGGIRFYVCPVCKKDLGNV